MIPDLYVYPTRLSLTPSEISLAELKIAQETDDVISKVKRALENGFWPSVTPGDHPDVSLFHREVSKLLVKDELLCQQVSRPDGKKSLQLILCCSLSMTIWVTWEWSGP